MDKKELLHRLKKIKNIPTLPVVMKRVLTLVENPQTSAADLDKIISTDQALTAKMLKLANSAYFAQRQKIITVTQAVVILGFNAVKSLALSAVVMEQFAGLGNTRFNRERFWAHAAGVGLVAKTIARQLRLPHPEEYVYMGLLHDLGKVALDAYFPDEFTEVIDRIYEHNIRIVDAEDRVLGLTHQEIGKRLAQQWNFPLSLTEAIGHHHQFRLADEENRRAVAIVCLADTIAQVKGIGNNGDETVPELDFGVAEYLKLSVDPIRRIVDDRELNQAAARIVDQFYL